MIRLEHVTKVYEGLPVEPPKAGVASRTLSELVTDLAYAQPPVRAVKVMTPACVPFVQ